MSTPPPSSINSSFQTLFTLFVFLLITQCVPAAGISDVFTVMKRLRDDYNFNPTAILDVGAFRGEWSLQMHHIFPSAHFTLIEGNREMLPYLLEKNLGQVIISLVGAENKEITFYKHPDAATGNSIYLESTKYFKQGTEEVTLPMHTLDSLLTVPMELHTLEHQKLKNYEILKIDVQGAEFDVLLGGQDYILESVQVLQLEISILPYNKDAPLAGEVISFVTSLGFRMYEIVELHHIGNILNQVDVVFIKESSDLWEKIHARAGLSE